jgi:hypothetical protein
VRAACNHGTSRAADTEFCIENHFLDTHIRPAHPGPLPWWEHMSRMEVTPFSQDWFRSCSFCGHGLLSQERDGWCCRRGRLRLPPLPLCDDLFRQLEEQYGRQLSRVSRRLNNLFAFSAIGTTGRFVDFQGLANGVLEGRVYHRRLTAATACNADA